MKPGDSGVVAVPRWLLLSLAVGLAASALTAAFLLGRESARSELATASVPGPVLRATAGPDAAQAAAAAPADPAASDPASSQMKSTTSSSAISSDPGALPPASRAVAAWLDRLDRALMEGKTWTDPDTMAQTILEDALAGRTDGFDRLIAGNQSVHDRVLALAPPPDCPECARYHAATAAVLSDSIRLLRRLRESTATGDLGALAGAQGEAQGLEARARDIERLDRELRAAYRLP